MLRRFMAKAQLVEATRVLDNTHHDIITTSSRHRCDHHDIITTSQITMNGTLFAGILRRMGEQEIVGEEKGGGDSG